MSVSIRKRFQVLFLLVAIIFLPNYLSAQLTGVKTIGGSSPDYATLAAAITALNSSGVGAGGVTFNLRDGTYPGGTAIASITAVGTSGNPIVFQSESGDSSLVVVSSATASNVITVSGGAYITFNKITVDYTSNGSYAALKLTLNADNITVNNCIMDGSSATGTTYGASVIYASESSAANNCDNFHVYNSVVRNGSYGIYFAMTSTSQSTGLEIQNNKFSENAAGGIRPVNHLAVIISGNSIYRGASVNTYYGVYADNCDGICQITRNYIYTTGSGTIANGIYLTNSSASSAGNSDLSNNSIQVVNGASSCYGINQQSTSKYWNIYNNTVYISSSTSASSYCYYTFSSNDSTKLINNIFIHAGSNTGGTANQTVYIPNSSGVKKYSNNCYYTVNTGNPFRASRGGVSYTAYSTYAAAVGEISGINIDPTMVFTAGLGWKATNPTLTGAGLYLASVPTDIDGKDRLSPNTTIGAHENGIITSPTIIVSTVSLSAFTTIIPTPSVAQTYTVEGQNLTNDIVVTAPLNFELREQGIGSFGSSVSFTPVGGNVSTKTIEARYNPSSAGIHNGTITHTSTDATEKDVDVSGTSTHYMCGTYTIGSGGGNDYSSLSEAIEALNLAIVTCDILLELQTDYDGSAENTAMTINQVTTGKSANITIRPASSVSSMLTTSGNPGSASPLLTLNGADNLTLDGRPGGSGTDIMWTIRNSRTASTVGPTITLTNGANNNTLQYLKIEGQNTTSTSGTVYISGYPAWTSGNNNITIQNCDITKYSSGGATHVNAIYAYGQTANPNSNINILNNNIHSFTPGLNYEASGITVTGTGLNTNYGDNWTISGNSFYLDCAEQQLHRYTVINFIPGLGSTNNLISNNYIGGGEPLCGGTAWTSAVGGAGNTIQTFEGIYVWAGATTIADNTVSNISLTATGGTSFGAIHLADCNNSSAYTITRNLIGNPETCNSISNAGQWKTVGIWVDNSCGNISVTDNVIANITATNAVNNAATVTGIYSDCGSNTISGNTIYNLTATVANSTTRLYIAHDGSVVGIADKSIYSGTTQSVFNNIIYGLKSNYSGATANKLYGIYTSIGEPGQLHQYDANLIFGFDVDNGSSNAQLIGIGAVGSSWASAVTSVFSNNMISLGYRVDGSSITSGAEITGIVDNTSGYTSGANTTYINYYYNSVYIGGTGITGSTNNTYAFRRKNTNISPKNTDDIRNNIFVNCRSNSTGAMSHYSIYLDNASTFTSDYNVCWGDGNGYKFGNAASVDYTTLANWQSGVSMDALSVNSNPLFYSPSSGVPDLHIQTGSPAINAGTGVSTTTDFDGDTRSGAADIGADDFSSAYTFISQGVNGCGGIESLPVELLSFTAEVDESHVDLKWSTASEINNDYFTIERSKTLEDFEVLFNVQGAGNSNSLLFYNATDADPFSGLSFYRLKQTDFDGSSSFSEAIPVFLGDKLESGIINTFVDYSGYLNVFYNACQGDEVTIFIYDLKGQVVSRIRKDVSKGLNQLLVNVSVCSSGMYLLKICDVGKVYIDKIHVP